MVLKEQMSQFFRSDNGVKFNRTSECSIHNYFTNTNFVTDPSSLQTGMLSQINLVRILSQ